jgi:Domain of unknown function (DUF3899)
MSARMIWIWGIAIGTGGLILALITSRLRMLALINHSFILGLLFLTLAGLSYVIQGGFFTLFIQSFKRFNRFSPLRLFGPRDEWDEAEDEEENPKRNARIKTWGMIFGIAGVLLTGLSFTLLYLR